VFTTAATGIASWPSGVADQACPSFLHIEGFTHSADVAGPAFDADEQGSSGGIRECDDGREDTVGRRLVARELERLPLGRLSSHVVAYPLHMVRRRTRTAKKPTIKCRECLSNHS
jgi:hypothetical protein